jgi:hypothetical protein
LHAFADNVMTFDMHDPTTHRSALSAADVGTRMAIEGHGQSLYMRSAKAGAGTTQ